MGKKLKNQAFTLIEMLTVIIILAIIILLALPRFSRHLEKTRYTNIINDIKVVESASTKEILKTKALPENTNEDTTDFLEAIKDRRVYTKDGYVLEDVDDYFKPIFGNISDSLYLDTQNRYHLLSKESFINTKTNSYLPGEFYVDKRGNTIYVDIADYSDDNSNIDQLPAYKPKKLDRIGAKMSVRNGFLSFGKFKYKIVEDNNTNKIQDNDYYPPESGHPDAITWDEFKRFDNLVLQVYSFSDEYRGLYNEDKARFEVNADYIGRFYNKGRFYFDPNDGHLYRNKTGNEKIYKLTDIVGEFNLNGNNAGIRNRAFQNLSVDLVYDDLIFEENQDGEKDKIYKIDQVIVGELNFPRHSVKGGTPSRDITITKIGKNAFTGNEISKIIFSNNIYDIDSEAFSDNQISQVEFINYSTIKSKPLLDENNQNYRTKIHDNVFLNNPIETYVFSEYPNPYNGMEIVEDFLRIDESNKFLLLEYNKYKNTLDSK